MCDRPRSGTHLHVPLHVAWVQTIPNTSGERVRIQMAMMGRKTRTILASKCFQYKLVAAQWRARSRVYMELTHFSPRMRKSYLKIPEVPRSIHSANRVIRDGALHRRGRNPSNHQWLPHVMEHIPSYVQQPVCGDRTAVSKPLFFL